MVIRPRHQQGVRENATDIFKEFTDLKRRYGKKWEEDFKRDRGVGWQQLPGVAETEQKFEKIFVDYAKKGYKVYGEYPHGAVGAWHYKIYVKKLTEGVGEAEREKPETKNWKDLITSLRVRNYNWKYIIEEVSKKYYYVPEKEIVDFIISKYIGRENLKKAVYKPERRIVFLAPIEGFPTSVPGISYYYLVEGVGMRYFTDLSFDPFEISMLEKKGMYPPEATVDELRNIIGEYRQGLVDAASAMEKIREVVERM